ncbi:MAG: DUF6089 family protein [Cytophagaceae bacterium]|jgi:outer membrane protein OmpA-like peptidoglycan-associated protein|nr:DUF6089 family protein [Cytophagaceae bacterium]
MKFKMHWLIGIALLCALPSFSQTPVKRLTIGLSAGVREYQGDLGNDFYIGWLKPKFTGGINLGYYLSPSFDLGLMANYGMLKHYHRKSAYYDERFLESKMLDFSVFTRLKMNNGKILKENAFVGPYLLAGVGMYMANDNVTRGEIKNPSNVTSLDIPVGVGLRFRLSDAFSMHLQTTFHQGFKDTYDGKENSSRWYDKHLHHSLGLNYNFGKFSPRDSDGDGVPDFLDKCPDTKSGYKVDALGCPLDTDKDGLVDSEDACPDMAGTAALKGCPDSDGDGVADNADACPKVAGLSQFAGCPDSDGDGIEDYKDKCPNEKGLASTQGCPDSDGDGVIDANDQCPSVKGLAALAGCPDGDGDGVSDKEDKCPTVAGLLENKGCPAIKEEVKQKLSLAAKGVFFETGKDVIKKESFDDLDNLVAILNSEKDVNCNINGHTDNVGDEAKNVDLSKRRAEAVKAYLISKGIAAERLTAEGFGSSKPLADNKTAAGRALNRRVEFVLSY